MDVERLIRKDFPKVGPETKISEIVGKMLGGEDSVAVLDGHKFLGVISANEIIERDYSIETKARHLVRKNTTRIEDKVDDALAAKIFLESNVKAVPVFSKKKLVGLLYEKDLVRNTKCIEKKKTTEELATVPEVIEKNESIGKARKIVKENNISRLPVVDGEGKLVGMLDTLDFLKTINPKESLGKWDNVGEHMPEYRLPVTTIMNSSPVYVEGNVSCCDVIDLFKKRNSSYLIITREMEPMGIVTSKDILEMIASLEKGDGVYIQTTGLEEVEDSFDREKIDSVIEEYGKKIGKIYEGTEYFFVHIKSSQKKGEQRLYSIRARVSTAVGLYVSRSSGWNVITSVEEAMKHLEKQVTKDHEKIIESKRSKRIKPH